MSPLQIREAIVDDFAGINMTRSARPYAIIVNVVTDENSRGKGYGRRVLQHALAFAWNEGCYKAMLQTGSKKESTHDPVVSVRTKRRVTWRGRQHETVLASVLDHAVAHPHCAAREGHCV